MKMQSKSALRQLIENQFAHLRAAFGAPRFNTCAAAAMASTALPPTFRATERTANVDPRGGHRASVSIPLCVTPCRKTANRVTA